MEPRMVSLGWVMVVLTILTLVGLVYLGWYSYKKRLGVSIKDFFVANKALGFVVLGLALFANAYSGNSFLGYAANSYRSGAWFIVYPQFMIAGLIGGLIIAPPLINLGKKWKYVSPFDYIEHRFNSKLVVGLALIFMIWGTFVQFAEQFLAMGYLGEVASGGVLPYRVVMLIFATVILLYTAVGGFRGTALTSAVQGILMVLSVVMMLVLIGLLGGFSKSMNIVSQVAPNKLTIPSGSIMRTWYSTIILILLGLPTYAHVLQVYLGSLDVGNLKRSFGLQVPLFFFTAFVIWLLGLFGAGIFPNLSKLESDKIVPYLMGALSTSYSYGRTIASFVGLGVITATLSTAGAALIVLSMILSKEIYKRFINPKASDETVIKAGRVSIGLFIILAIIMAFMPGLTIWRWTEIKFELLLQATPVLIFGLFLHRIKKTPIIIGMLAGGVISITLTLMGFSKVYGVHSGVLGFVINSLIVLIGSYLTREDQETERAKEILKYRNIEITDDGQEVKYILPAQTKIFWIGLAVVLALLVPWYGPKSWNASSALGLPIWTWVIVFTTVLESLFVIFGMRIWRKE